MQSGWEGLGPQSQLNKALWSISQHHHPATPSSRSTGPWWAFQYSCASTFRAIGEAYWTQGLCSSLAFRQAVTVTPPFLHLYETDVNVWSMYFCSCQVVCWKTVEYLNLFKKTEIVILGNISTSWLCNTETALLRNCNSTSAWKQHYIQVIKLFSRGG